MIDYLEILTTDVYLAFRSGNNMAVVKLLQKHERDLILCVNALTRSERAHV